MPLDLALYRRQVRVSTQPLVRLSAIDIAPDHPQRTIVFLHGYGGHVLQWQYQLHRFSDANRAIALDLRGHGQSDKPGGDYSMERIQKDIEAALRELEVAEQFVLAGHSFGGAVATEYAVAHPDRVACLILIATAGEFKLNPLYRLLLRFPQSILSAAGPFVRRWLGAPPHVMHAWYHQNLSKWIGWSLFRSVSAPTLVIRGHLDLVFERPHFEEVARTIPNADELDVGASGHMVMLERREAVNRAIERAIERARETWRGEAKRSARSPDRAAAAEASFRDDSLQAKRSARSPDRAAAEQASFREGLLQQRPWLSHYDEGVPYTVAIPPVPLHHLLRSAAQRFPRKTALIFEGNRITYRRLQQEVNRFANALRSLGIDRGDRVMLLLPNLPQAVIAFFGVLEAGAAAVFSLPSNDPGQLVQQLRESQARALVTLTQYDSLVQQIRKDLALHESSSLQSIIFTHIADYLPFLKRLGYWFSRENRKRHLFDATLDATMHFFNRMLYTHSPEPLEVPVGADELVAIHYTGGTTAEPKGVMLSHRNLVANALQTRHWLPDAREGQERFLCVLPFAHSYGLTTALNVPIALGAALILKPVFDVPDTLKTIQRHRPTIFPGVPSMYVAIKDFPGVRRYGIQSIKACISGSAPLPLEVQESFEKLTRGNLVEGYGLTEASPVTHANPMKGKRKVGSIGIPLPSTEACVVDLIKNNEQVGAGQIGELAVRGPQVMLGYWNNPKDTKRAFNRGGWLLTGDVAQMDSDGYFRIIARKAEMWYPEKPGEPAFPRDVEEVLYEIPQVKEAAVVAIADQPVAFVIARKENISAEAIIAYSKRRLPPDLVPRFVIFVDEFPRTFIGKVIRRELAKRVDQFKLS